jgi:hypothetical protein
LQPVFAQQQGGAILMPKSIPVVPPIMYIHSSGGHFGHENVQLDGTSSSGTTYEDVTFEYGGGAYRLDNPMLIAPIKLTLTGAAGNTGQLLQQLGLLGCQTEAKPLPAIPLNQPMQEAALIKTPFTGDLISPFGQAGQ